MKALALLCAMLFSGLAHAGPLNLCLQPGVDPTGVADSRDAVQSASGQPLYLNCPVFVHVGYDPTKPVFIHSGTTVTCGPLGKFLVDNNTIAEFVMQNAKGVSFTGCQFQYVGALAINNAVAPYYGVAGRFNDTQMKADLVAQGYSFSNGGSSYWAGPTNAAAMFVIRGSTTATFTNNWFGVVPGTNASKFIPVVFSIDPQWKCCTVTTNGNPATATTANAPVVTYDANVFDGTYMGWTGTGGSNTITNHRSYRYSDLQAADGSNAGGCSNPGSGACWLAPPHHVYLQGGDPSLNAANTLAVISDFGPYVGGVIRRPAGSGTLLSLKLELTHGSSVTGYFTARPDGCEDVIANWAGAANGSINGFVCIYDSTVATADGKPIWGMRFPSANPYVGVTFSNYIISDTAASPVHFPVSNMYGNNNGVTFGPNFTIYQHLKSGAQFPQLNGTNIRADLTLYIDSCSGGRPAGNTNDPGTVYGC
jgi:hypothetical protein